MAFDVGKAVAGSLIFAVVWLLLLRNRWRWLPLGRAVGALAGASAMVASGVLSPHAAFAAINLETIGLLLGCMLVSAHLEAQGGYTLLARVLSGKGSPAAFLARLCATAAVAAALLTNDTTCVILTPIVIDACRGRKLHPAPFLLAVATSANIGASCSPIGSPQAMIIATTGEISFLRFLGWLGVPTLIGVALNFVIIWVMYRRQLAADFVFDWSAAASSASSGGDATVPAKRLSDQHAETVDHGSVHPSAPAVELQEEPANAATAVALDVAPDPTQTSPPISSDAAAAAATASAHAAPALPAVRETPLRRAQRYAIYALLCALPLVLIFADGWIGLGWTTLLFASALCVVYAAPPEPLLERVDAGLLLFFSGLFICVGGFNATGIPSALWDAVGGAVSVRSGGGVAVYTVIVLLGSQVVSNVPLVLLMAPKILAMPHEDATLAWALLQWVSTVAGNLTLLGSVANLIVAERAKDAYPLRFGEYARVGVPSTLAMCVLGVPMTWALASAIG